ncbi:MAG TPA: hypothetical protein VFZ31_06815 [Vicinamibacterales bacterium]
MRLLLTVALFASLLASPAHARERDGGQKLRPQDERIVLAIKEGSARSTTFKALVDRIEAGDVIVYVATNPMIKSTLSGALTWMTRAGEFRYVRASLAPDLPFDQLIASVAHELHHAVEVIEDPTVVDEKSLVDLYRRIGLPSRAAGPSGWETIAAQRTGSQVRRELVAVPTTIIARASASQS